MRRKLSDLDPMLSPPFRDQWSRADEEREDAETRWWEENDWLLEIAPDEDPDA